MLGWLNRLRTRTAAPPPPAPSPAADAPPPAAVVAAPEVAAPPAAVAAPEAVAPPPSADIPRDKITARAYEIWVRKGKPHGRDFENWTEAEAELRAEFAAHPDAEPLPRKSR
jgi:hypothetical protein